MKYIILVIVFLNINSLYCQNQIQTKKVEFYDIYAYKNKHSMSLGYQFSYGGSDIYRHYLDYNYYFKDNHFINPFFLIEERNHTKNDISFTGYSMGLGYGYHFYNTGLKFESVIFNVIGIGGLGFNSVTNKDDLLDNSFYMDVRYGVKLQTIIHRYFAINIAYQFSNNLFNQNTFGYVSHFANVGVQIFF